jgi:hypothetical protein
MNISDERRLTRLIEKYGEDDPYVQMFKSQMKTKETWKGAQETYITGMMKKAPEKEQ